MSVYELLDYDRLLDRIGIDHDEKWFCGNNPVPQLTYDEAGITYDDVVPYDGYPRHGRGGLCLTSDINVNGLVLNHRDEHGTTWLCTGIEGWWTLPPSEIPDVPKPYWDGSLLTTGRYQPRTITITGCFIPPDPSWVWYNRDQLLRVASIVRGVGLIALCGNESPDITDTSSFYDPSKMAIIQMNDVPLVDTTKPNGFTEFSLSFKCAQPTKLSVHENTQTLPIPSENPYRAYASFSKTLATGDTSGAETTYIELKGTDVPDEFRPYSDVKLYNPDAPIQDEDFVFAEGVETRALVVHNSGNYFSFPVFVLEGPLDGVSATKPLTVSNTSTGETMRVIKPIETGKLLIIDTGSRRVAVVSPNTLPQTWTWNDRNYLSLGSAWISLAAGDNQFFLSKFDNTISAPKTPRIYWRDTWIG